MTMKSICLAIAAAATIGTAADAAIIYANGVTWVNNGTVGSSNDRDDPTQALGAPDGLFSSLGLAGEADYTFGKTFSRGKVRVTEATFDRAAFTAIGDEAVQVFAGLGAANTFVGSISATGPDATFKEFSLAIPFSFDTIKLVDISAVIAKRDGFDVESIGVSAIPLPASVLFLGAGLAGLGLVRRKA